MLQAVQRWVVGVLLRRGEAEVLHLPRDSIVILMVPAGLSWVLQGWNAILARVMVAMLLVLMRVSHMRLSIHVLS